MIGYGHDVQFGSFVLPSNSNPLVPVELARESERAGLDLVTFQDHPYHPGMLDTWTLLSWAAASTHRIRLAPSVLNLALRPPAVVARSAASLDLLSDGRLELGLGAGFFWDAIAAMGGPRLSGGEAVRALDEAIDVIRGVWDADNPDRFVVNGRHHRVDGAMRGPAPAHDIALWVGGYKQRMLELIGRKADGWLPGVAYLDSLDAIRAGNRVIDDAAEAAGRAPSAIRRLLNLNGTLGTKNGFPIGNATDWIEQLAELAIGDGVATFVISSDDANDIAVFGNEVAPAVRRAVADEAKSSR